MVIADLPKRMKLDDFVKNRHWDGVLEDEVGKFYKALHTAVYRHDGQKRLGGWNYYEHLLVVADALNSLGFDIEVQNAGLLHDVIEDCDINLETIRTEFGERVADLVQSLSKNKNAPESYWEQLYLGTKLHFQTIFIKMVDRWHNLVTVYSFRDVARQIRYLEETTGPLNDVFARCRPLIPKSHLADFDELTVKIFTLAQSRLARIRRKIARRHELELTRFF